MRVPPFHWPRAASLPCLATTLSLLAACASEARALQLSPIPNVVTSEDTPTAPVPFTISGETTERPAALLITSSNPTLVPEANVRFGRTESGRSLIITPAPNQSGHAIVQVQATDGSITVTQSFSVTVTSQNDAPTISRIPDQTIAETTGTARIPFTIGDVETPAASLTVSASSSDTTLLPSSSIALSGTGANRALTLQPASGKSGTATVTVTVTDGQTSSSQGFQVMIGSVNRAPLVNAGADQTIVGTNAAVLNGTATDDNSSALLTSWSVVSPAANVSLVDANALNTTVHFARPGIYTLRLTVSDGEFSESDEVTIVVAAAQLAAIQAQPKKRR